MDQDETAELQALRARAYGPAADAELSAADWARLDRLEAAARGAAVSAAASASDGSAAARDEPQTFAQLLRLEDEDMSSADEVAAEDTDADPDTVDDVPDGRRRPRRRMLLWVGAVALTAIVCVAVTYAIASVRPVAPETGAQQVATLTPLPGATFATSFTDDPDADQYEFLGLSLVSSDAGLFNFPGTCLAAVPTVSLGPEGQLPNWVFVGCAAGRFPPMVQFEVDAGSPGQLQERYPVGSGIRFVADGDAVGVFVTP